MSARAFVAARSWLEDGGLRLDATAYAGGGLQARDRILDGPWEWRPLGEVADVWLPNRFSRRYVSDPSHGLPLLSSSDMLLADLKGLGLISRATPNLSTLSTPPGATLVSRSGTIGRTAYVRSEMVGMPVTDHALRVAARGDAAPAGFLYAFLSSSPAQAMIRQRMFGSVVQHIEASDLVDLPVPILPEEARTTIHKLIVAAGDARTEAGHLLDLASDWFDSQVPARRYLVEHARAASVVASSKLAVRLDAFHHVGWAAEATLDGERLGHLARVHRPGLIKRIFVERGTPFISGIDVFQLRPTSRNRLMTAEAQRAEAFVSAGQIVVQRSGQRYGLLGRPAYIGSRLNGAAASEDLMRISSDDASTTAQIFAYLRSDIGRRSLLRMSYGTSIPHFNPEQLAQVRVPDLPSDLADGARRALELRENADAFDDAALAEVERWLD